MADLATPNLNWSCLCLTAFLGYGARSRWPSARVREDQETFWYIYSAGVAPGLPHTICCQTFATMGSAKTLCRGPRGQ